MARDLFSRIGNLGSDLSKKNKALVSYFLNPPDNLAFQTLSEVARNAEVSEPTVIRFVRLIGYKGFVDFKEDLQRITLEKFGPSDRFNRRANKKSKKITEVARAVFDSDIQNLRITQKTLNMLEIEQIANEIIQAEKKYVIGLRSASALAKLLGCLLDYILPGVKTIQHSGINMFEDIRAIGEKDVLIAIAYPRYVKNSVEAIRIANNHHAKTITITDSPLSPTAQITKRVIIAPSNSIGFSNSYTACLCVINLLITFIANINGQVTDDRLREWEKAIEPFDFFLRV